MTPQQLIKKSFKGFFAIDRALRMLEAEFSDDPHVCEMLKAFKAIFRTYAYKPRRSSYGEFIRKIERREY